MKLSIKEVEHVAELARLELSDEEKNKFVHQLSNILTHIEKLNQLDTSNIEPTSHVLPLKNIFRDDVTQISFQESNSLENAPDKDKGYYKVPKIIEEA
ncbi:MAG: asparaginyl/glutamyl-tRNA amidotransferase subunit C [Nitrospinae bacterium RIFCSPLOWO2_02_FULL_39_110]|nr:MAG: asparaginyl/glutamyl-tRNA amidotransferase subunit C [Nitrospinae bacterium RIFCSPHIGHO2_12_FULL_39_42]OGV98889.1 MAG: asparaginyl/glutamyl-tRNA amidotransferase subunit C [Nitrospinae bacterium RIFCSPHIGHO2_02_39_11]OGW03222.1 MAG: asparaginyl/glutamyl-tRNA amidotransferase subunit C [Nitrospinae bacterium RIFCSPHIGHO2_02_FULL_39_82]OGW06054.1 MAG: asparaginyl/glutamyl-tRNA amidotransferase subunit C [Nitrospinae bacterium RIFCSPLOWO2_02_39_17]OGW06704.1 MAG: asparaginyl/glutamyl-tRNA 